MTIRTTILAFSVIILILFLIITGISIWQYTRYKIVDGTAICNVPERCLLVFNYKNPRGEQKTNVSAISFQEINQTGVFSVQVAYTLNPQGDPKDFFLIGSPFHVFIGTKSMLLIYVTLAFLAALICISFIPGLYSVRQKI